MIVAVLLLLLLCMLGLPQDVRAQAYDHNHFAGETGVPDPCTHNTSTQAGIDAFLASAQPGQTLCIGTGAYGRLHTPTSLIGTDSQRITIRALTDGQVSMDGTGSYAALDLQGQYVNVEGINFIGTISEANLVRGTHNIARRVTFLGPVSMAGIGDNVLEDCAVFGPGRKMVMAGADGGNYSAGNIVRRCWATWEQRTPGDSPTNTFEMGYSQDSVTFENLLGTRHAGATANENSPEAPFQLFRTQNSRWLGSIAYAPATSNFNAGRLMDAYGDWGYLSGDEPHPTRNALVRDVAVVISPNHARASSVVAFGFFQEPIIGTPNTLTNVVGIAGSAGACEAPTWQGCGTIRTAATRAGLEAQLGQSIWTALPGICHRVINGSQTTQPLWPWPMRQRIMDALRQAGRTPVDVQAQLEASDMLGPIPAACMEGGQQPVATSVAFGQQPVASQTNTFIAPAPTVRILDQFGSVFDTTATITISLIDNTEGATLSGTLARAAQNGVSTFNNLTINLPGTYRLRATGLGFTVDSISFTVTHPSDIATSLAFGQQPGQALVGTTMTPAPTVRVLDGAGDLFTASPVSVTVHAVPTARRLSLPGGANKRYVVDPDGRPVFLTGSHTWNNLQDTPAYGSGTPFDWDALLRRMQTGWDTPAVGAYQPRQNFIRLWHNEHFQTHVYSPHPFEKTGPGTDAAGLPNRWDFNQSAACQPITAGVTPIKFNQTYFDRVATRVAAARDVGIYVGVMLFQGWSTYDHGAGSNPYLYHWFNPLNNCNGVDGSNEVGGYPEGARIHTEDDPILLYIQQQYVQKMIDTLHGYENVLWEIANESGWWTLDWQEGMVDFIKAYETAHYPTEPHLVGITAWAESLSGTSTPAHPSTLDTFQERIDWLMASNADWTSLPMTSPDSPPVVAMSKPNIDDNDHTGGEPHYYHRLYSFMRGNGGVIYMDGHDAPLYPHIYADSGLEDDHRRAMAQLWAFAQRLDLLNLTVQTGGTSPSSTGFALYKTAAPAQYLVYHDWGNIATFTLTGIPAGTYTVTWLNVDNGQVVTPANVTNPGSTWSIPYGNTDGWILLLRQTTSPAELVLGGTTTQTSSNGIATFTDLTLPRTGQAYLWASAPTLVSDTSTAFTITSGAPTATALTLVPPVPTTAVVNAALSPAIVVQVVDQSQTPYIPSPAISLSLAKASGPGTCTGLGPVTTDGSGRATFSATSCDTAGTVTLTASSSGLTPVTTGNIVITAAPPVPTSLAFETQPTSTYLGTILAPVRVGIRDQQGLLLPSASATVTVALTTPGGAVLGGDSQNATSSGVATFSDLTVNKAGTYTLTATAVGLTPAVSSAFTITITPPPTLVLHWPMLEGAGTVLNDAGASGTHDATFCAVAQAPAWVTGPTGGTTALVFTQAQQDCVTNTTFPWTAGAPITVVAWVKTVGGTPTSNQGLFLGGTPGEESFSIGATLRNTQDQLEWYYGGWTAGGRLTWTWGPSLVGQWTRIGLTASGTSGSFRAIYVNGQRVASATNSIAPTGNRTGVILGRHNWSGVNEWCNCEVADFRMLDRTWTDQDALSDYQGTPPPAGISGLPWSIMFGHRH
jgi:hypothetical protein